MTDKLMPAVSDPAVLRRQAEQRVSSHRPKDEDVRTGPIEVPSLLHELEVHEVELEMQNEELRAARLELEHSLARYTELFDFAPLGYATLDGNAAVRELNHAGAILLGQPRSRLIGRPFHSFVAPSHRPKFGGFIELARTSDAKQVLELELWPAHDVVIHVRLTAVRLPRSESSVLLALEDISERKAKDAQLERSELALREADHRKDEFLAALSHELRNPLAPIRNAVFMLGNAQLSVAQSHKTQDIIERQVTHLTRLIDDLLDVTRIRRGKISLQKERTELAELVRRTLEDHRRGFEMRGVELEAEFDSIPTWVCADPARVVQVLSNLLGNAEKFTDAGDRVVVSLRSEESHAVLQVHDTGTGISGSVLPQLFEPFAQGPQTIARSRGGLGLGLSMVKGLVELHDGTVAISSAGAGRGTQVTVKLPLDAEPAPPVENGAPAPTRPLRVFLIEDNPDAADTLKIALEFMGHEVQTAYDGPSGLAGVKAFRPDVVICDVGLPGMDGYAVAGELRREPSCSNTYLIALSGYARPEDLRRAQAAGFNQHLAKPVGVLHLCEVLAGVGANETREVNDSIRSVRSS